MIETFGDLLLQLGNLAQPFSTGTKIRVFGDHGRYKIKFLRVSKDDGALVLWIDERGDQNDFS